MKVTRRVFSKGCAMAATGLAIGEVLPALAQVQGEHFSKSAKHPVPSIQDTETPAQKNQRMKWFREARFGMFIHWGLYAIPAGRWNGAEVPGIGEWIMNRASIPVADYKALAPKFNPAEFSASEIAGIANATVMMYIVITSKHHDGSEMSASKAYPFNIVLPTHPKLDPPI